MRSRNQLKQIANREKKIAKLNPPPVESVEIKKEEPVVVKKSLPKTEK